MPAKKLQVKSKKLKVTIKKTEPKRGLLVDVFDTKGKVIGKAALPRQVFQAKINEKLMAQAVRVYLANQRQGTLSTKTRGEVRGSTRKLYRQKGTGRARAGSIRSPLRVGGGIIFGPKPRDFSLKLSKKMKKAALFSALSSKLSQKAIHVIDGLEQISPKTKKMAQVLQENKLYEKKESVLLVLPKNLENVMRATRNIEGVELTLANSLNAYTVLVSSKMLLMKDAIETIEKTWKK